MELPRRTRGDELLRPGELASLRKRLRNIARKHDLATVIACAFDHRTRMLPFIYADMRMAPAGVRAIGVIDGRLHVLTGSIDSNPSESVLLKDHPTGDRAYSQHYRFQIPSGPGAVGNVRIISDLGPARDAEGLIALLRGGYLYAFDDNGGLRLGVYRNVPPLDRR